MKYLSLWLLFLSITPRALAVPVLSLSPDTQTVSTGDFASVDLDISGLGNFTTPSLGSFKVEVLYDPSILDYDHTVVGNLLGDPSDPSEIDPQVLSLPGSVTVDVVSLLLDFELDALQRDSFTLATLSFKGKAPGSSDLSYSQLDLSDAPGNTLNPDTTQPASITVTSAAPTIPEPGTVVLFGMGLVVAVSSLRMRTAK